MKEIAKDPPRRTAGPLQQPYSMAMLLCDIRRKDRAKERKVERRTAKSSNLFPFSLSHEQSQRWRWASLTFKGHFPAILSDDCSHVGTWKLSFHVVVLRIHARIKLTGSADFMVVLSDARGEGKSFGLKLRRYELVVPLQRIHRPESFGG